jgi:hypothetical protein
MAMHRPADDPTLGLPAPTPASPPPPVDDTVPYLRHVDGGRRQVLAALGERVQRA